MVRDAYHPGAQPIGRVGRIVLQRQPRAAEAAKGGRLVIVWLPDPAWWSRVTMNSQVRDIECSASEAPPASAQSTCLSGPKIRAHKLQSRPRGVSEVVSVQQIARRRAVNSPALEVWLVIFESGRCIP